MPARRPGWLTAQQAAIVLNTTSAEVCRLISIGRLSGKKHKQLGRPGNAQWTINPTSIKKESRRAAKLAAAFRRKNAARKPK
jgi:hypothetical protein